ncbi:MAG: hydrogenase expression protein HupH [Rhodospirillaceae bacterium]|nr:hydrogenase expression protein HupH [Rhodospirillaceae bacterium]
MTESQLLNRKEQSTKVKLNKNIELYYQPVKAAPRTFVSQEDYLIADVGILEAGLKAQEEGYHAICIDTVSDSGVAALRSVLDIPVIGPGRTMFLTALMLGEKFSIITMWKEWFGLYYKTLTDLNMHKKCASIRSIDVVPDNRELLKGKESDILPLLIDASKKCINEDGADVICLGSTTMHQAHAKLQNELDVPVINPGPLSYKTAETILSLKLNHSRKTYPKPKVPKHNMIINMIKAAELNEKNKPLEKIEKENL